MKQIRFLLFLLAALCLLTSCRDTADYLFVVTDSIGESEFHGLESSVLSDIVTEEVPLLSSPSYDNSVTGDIPSQTPSSSDITLVSLTETVKRGHEASLTICGIPGVTYSIHVFYATAESTAKGLEPKVADPDGYVTWCWRVGSRTKEGSHRIEIRGANDTLILSFTTTV